MKLVFKAIGVEDYIERVYRIASLSKPSANRISTVGSLRDGADSTLRIGVPTESTRERIKPFEGWHALLRGLDEEA